MMMMMSAPAGNRADDGYLQHLEALRKSRATTLELMGRMYDRQHEMLGQAPGQGEATEQAVHTFAASTQGPAAHTTLTVKPQPLPHQPGCWSSYTLVTDEEQLQKNAQHRIATMWHGFDSSGIASSETESDTDAEFETLTPSLESSSSSAPALLKRVPPAKPPRVAFVRQERRTKGAVEYEMEKKKNEEQLEAELSQTPAVRDPPGTTYKPLYSQMEKDWTTKAEQFRNLRRVHREHQQQRASSATDSDGRAAGHTPHKSRHRKCCANQRRTRFKARPVPMHVLDPDRTQQLEEQQFYRGLKIRMQAEEKLAQVAAPGVMEYRICEHNEKQRARRWAEKEAKAGQSSRGAQQRTQTPAPIAATRLSRSPSNTQRTPSVTRPQPFKLSEPRNKQDELKRIKKEMTEDAKQGRDDRWPFLKRPPPHPHPHDVDHKAYMAVGRGLRTRPVRETRAVKLRNEHTARKLEEREVAALAAEEEALRRQTRTSPRVREQVQTQARQNDTREVEAARRRMNALVFRKHQDVLEEAYRDHIDSIERRVAQRPTLMERVARHDRKDARRNGEDGGWDNDETNGTGDLPPRIPFAPSVTRTFRRPGFVASHFEDALESSASSSSTLSSSASFASPSSSSSSSSLVPASGRAGEAGSTLSSTTALSYTSTPKHSRRSTQTDSSKKQMRQSGGGRQGADLSASVSTSSSSSSQLSSVSSTGSVGLEGATAASSFVAEHHPHAVRNAARRDRQGGRPGSRCARVDGAGADVELQFEDLGIGMRPQDDDGARAAVAHASQGAGGEETGEADALNSRRDTMHADRAQARPTRRALTFGGDSGPVPRGSGGGGNYAGGGDAELSSILTAKEFVVAGRQGPETGEDDAACAGVYSHRAVADDGGRGQGSGASWATEHRHEGVGDNYRPASHGHRAVYLSPGKARGGGGALGWGLVSDKPATELLVEFAQE